MPESGGMIIFERDHPSEWPVGYKFMNDMMKAIGLDENDWSLGNSLGTPTIHFRNEEHFVLAKLYYAT